MTGWIVKSACVCLIVCNGVLCAAEFPGLGPKGDLQQIEFEPAGSNTLIGQNARKQLRLAPSY